VPLPAPTVAHVGVAVRDLSAVAFYRDILGAEPRPPETADGATIVSLPLGGGVDVELLVPNSPDSPVGRFLERRGPGIHHICFRVPNLDRALEACRDHGYRLVDEHPRPGAGGRRVAFVHPKATAGILLELTE
jgi:methylmalonyl-CoA/ethylmalonyl-CoA epimerase